MDPVVAYLQSVTTATARPASKSPESHWDETDSPPRFQRFLSPLAALAAEDPANLQLYFRQLEANIEAGIQTGFVQNTVRARHKLMGDAARAVLEEMLETDPASVNDVLESGHLRGLTHAEEREFHVSAAREIENLAADADLQVSQDAPHVHRALFELAATGELKEHTIRQCEAMDKWNVPELARSS